MTRWIDRAIKCCGGPILFYTGIYVLLGVLFIVGSLYLDPLMRHVGLVLLATGVGILLLFLILAFPTFRRGNRQKDRD